MLGHWAFGHCAWKLGARRLDAQTLGVRTLRSEVGRSEVGCSDTGCFDTERSDTTRSDTSCLAAGRSDNLDEECRVIDRLTIIEVSCTSRSGLEVRHSDTRHLDTEHFDTAHSDTGRSGARCSDNLGEECRVNGWLSVTTVLYTTRSGLAQKLQEERGLCPGNPAWEWGSVLSRRSMPFQWP